MSRIFSIFHGRFPSEQAAALLAGQEARAFGREKDVVMLVPRRLWSNKQNAHEAYSLGNAVKVVYLPTIDLFKVPVLKKIAFPVSFAAFSIFVFFYLLAALTEDDVVETNESLPAFLTTFLSRRVVIQVHDFPLRFYLFYKLLFRRVHTILSTNTWKAEEIEKRFGIERSKILVERNAVDIEKFGPKDKVLSRKKLNLSDKGKIVVYTGHLYSWKGVDTLAKATELLVGVDVYLVGGLVSDVEQFKKTYGHIENLHIVGLRPHEEMPLWQSAADVLVLPNTAKEEISVRYTSPMKLFEYMASGTPIVASDLPSIREVVSDETAFFAKPDDAEDFALQINKALVETSLSKDRADAARAVVAEFSWEKRAKRLMERFQTMVGDTRIGKVRSFIVVPFAYAVLCVLILFPFLFQGQLIVGSDITTQYYAAFDFYHKALISGQSFLWSPLLFSGFPLYLSQVGGFFDPVNYILFHFFDGFDGLHIRLFLDYVLLLVVSFAAARVWGLSRVASFCVGLGYLLAFNETYVSNPLFANSAFLMPFLVWVAGKVRHHDGFTIGLAVMAGATVGFAFLGGYAQPIIMYLVLFGLLGAGYGLFVAKKRIHFLLRFSLFCAIIAAVGLVVGSPQIIPALQFTELTRRGAGVDYTLATLKAVDPGDVILFLFPDYTYFPYLAVGRVALFVGAVWFLLAFLMLRQILTRKAEETIQEARLFAGVFIFALATAFTHSPIFYAMQHLPIFDLFRFSDRWMYGGVFFLSMFAGYGLDLLPHARNGVALRRFFAILAVPTSLFVALIVFFNLSSVWLLTKLSGVFGFVFSKVLYGHGPFVKDLSHYQDAFLRGLLAWKEFVSFSDISFLLPTLLLVTGMVVVVLMLFNRMSLGQFKAAVLILMVLTFGTSLSRQISHQYPKSALQVVGEKSFMQYIPVVDREMYRFYPFMTDAGFRLLVPPTYRLTNDQVDVLSEVVFEAGWPNSNFHYNMPSVDGYDVFVPQDYIGALTTAGSTFGAQDNTRGISKEEKIVRVEKNTDLLGMMGGKYIVSGVELNDPTLTLLGMYPISRWKIPEYVYENSLALPRVYIAKRTEDAKSVSLGELLEQNRRDFISTTYLDCAECGSEGEGEIVTRHFENGMVRLSLRMKKASWVVFSESNLPGWIATLDQTPTPITLANGLYMAILVPEGEHEVVFQFKGMPLPFNF